MNLVAATEILIVLFLVALNGLLALSEMAIVTARKARLRQRAEQGDEGAIVALQLSADSTRFLSTIQIGITTIGILSGAFGGATIAEAIAVELSRITWLAPYSEIIGITLVVVVITFLSLVLGELVPKRLAQNNPEAVAVWMSRPMHRLSQWFSPVIGVLSWTTEIVLRLFGAQHPHSPSVTEEEIKFLIKEGAEIGVFEAVEEDMLKRVFRLGERKVSTLMTHRREVAWLDLDDRPEALEDQIISAQHSRLPVGNGSLDNIQGVLEVKEYLSSCVSGNVASIEELIHLPLFVPESLTVLELLEHFKRLRLHLAVVLDEYGGVIGIVTTTDVLEAIVGNLPVTSGLEEHEIVQREDGSWLIDGSTPIHEVKDVLDVYELPEEAEGNYETLGGLMMEQLGRIPEAGDYFDWNGLHFEIMDMDGHRVDKVLISLLPLD